MVCMKIAPGRRRMHLSSAIHPEPEVLDGAILSALRAHGVDMVLLAGYLKKLGPQVLQEFRGRLLNTHPALLPKYGGQGMSGRRIHEALLAAGDVEAGAPVHLVDAEYDTGAVIAQCRVPVRPGGSAESLSARALDRGIAAEAQ